MTGCNFNKASPILFLEFYKLLTRAELYKMLEVTDLQKVLEPCKNDCFISWLFDSILYYWMLLDSTKYKIYEGRF